MSQKRVALIDGRRTPFVKADTFFKNLTPLDMATLASRELLYVTGVDPDAIDDVVMGCVIPHVTTPNVAREVVINLGLPKHIPGLTLGRACASGLQAVSTGSEMILAGNAQVVLVGGTDSISTVPVPHSRKLINAFKPMASARSFGDMLPHLPGLFQLPPKEWLPNPPSIAEPSTGLTMGQHAELMARKNGISRESQDRFAAESHHKAGQATDDGRLTQEIAPVWVGSRYDQCVSQDPMIRRDTSAEALNKLRPSFDKRYGTITAGTASPLTDGASAALIMSEDKAKALGLKPKVFIRSWVYTALDPSDQLLLGPAYAIPRVLEKAGLRLSDMDLVDMHEAFAAQVLSNTQALASDAFARERLGRDHAVGEIDPAKLNVCGGSIAIGHPFAATGCRMLTTMANELERRDGQFALLSICAAGGMGVAMMIERER